jgi:hypothetical protein
MDKETAYHVVYGLVNEVTGLNMMKFGADYLH